jgi:hypothetical protein
LSFLRLFAAMLFGPCLHEQAYFEEKAENY